MESHYTPAHLASKIRRHLPKKISTVLEPSVGDGSLLLSLEAIKTDICVTAFDICGKAVERISKKDYAQTLSLDLNHSCFLDWYNSSIKHPRFDLVLMNPPFSGRSETWIEFNNRKVPIEIAFLKAGINLCSHSGTIIAILPKSVISGELKCSLEVREHLFSEINVTYCYELSEYEFPEIEGQFYLLVGKKEGKRSRTIIRNNDGDQLEVKRKFLRSISYRLDYSYINAVNNINDAIKGKEATFCKLDSITSIYRGSLEPPYDKDSVLHTTAYVGHWNINSSTIYNSKVHKIYVVQGDILVKRVGRNCLDSFGLVRVDRKQPVTDCILVIRPNKSEDKYKILLSLRVLYSHKNGTPLLQKGTGAKYISSSGLSEAKVIIDLDKSYRGQYKKYVCAVNNNNLEEMVHLETEVRQHLFGDQGLRLRGEVSASKVPST